MMLPAISATRAFRRQGQSWDLFIVSAHEVLPHHVQSVRSSWVAKSRKCTSIFISVHRANRFRAEISELCVWLEVLWVLSMKTVVPWDIIQFSPTYRYQLLRETYYFRERNPPVIYGWDGRNTAIFYLRIKSSSPKTDCCFVWVWNFVADSKGGKEAEGVWEYGIEENIWT